MMKSSQFWPPTQSEVKFDAYTETKWFSASIQTPTQISTTRTKPRQSIPILKNMSFSARTQKPSQLRSSEINHAIFGPHTTPKSILTVAQKQVEFYPDAKTK